MINKTRKSRVIVMIIAMLVYVLLITNFVDADSVRLYKESIKTTQSMHLTTGARGSLILERISIVGKGIVKVGLVFICVMILSYNLGCLSDEVKEIKDKAD